MNPGLPAALLSIAETYQWLSRRMAKKAWYLPIMEDSAKHKTLEDGASTHITSKSGPQAKAVRHQDPHAI